MEQKPVLHSTFVIERSYPATPERVFAAFADPIQKRRWFVEGDHHDVEQHDAIYQDIVPDRRVVAASTMTIGGQCISASLATFEFMPSEKGTDLIFTHQGAFFEGADGPEMREAGWRKLLDRLTEQFPR